MSLLSERQKLIASNIANVDTPGYRTQDIDFHSEFESAAAGEDPAVMEPEGLAVKRTATTSIWTGSPGCWRRMRSRFNIASNFA